MLTDMIQFIIYLIVLVALALPLGKYLAKVFLGQKTAADFLLRPIEKTIYRLAGIDDTYEMNWRQYAANLVCFNLAGMILLFILQLAQAQLPFNPDQQAGVAPWHVALNTAISFVTNTNWQAYSGESTMSHFTQMAGLTAQNFISAAVGMAVAVAFMRGLTRKSTDKIGNFWVDLVRGVVWVLLPLAILFTLPLMQQGVVQNLSPAIAITTVEGVEQVLPLGPVASQEAIKILGTNGGGFFNANSSHPFENPTPLTNFLQMLAMFLVPAALIFCFGHFAGEPRQGYAVFAASVFLFVLMFGVMYCSESYGNPLLAELGISGPTAMEGKEVRFGIAGSTMFGTITTATSCGAVNSMHDSFTPLAGLVAMLQMQLGELIFGGVGAGFYSIMLHVILTVFIVGLMVGRTPEYLGKKIQAREIQMVILAILLPSLVILMGTGTAVVTKAGLAGIANAGPHGLSEILYAFSSCGGNNGSAFAGLTVNTVFYDLVLGLAMLIGRFGVILPVLAIAGSMAEKKTSPPGPGTFPTTGGLFAALLVGIILIVGALTFFPALALGPVVEHLLMLQGTTF